MRPPNPPGGRQFDPVAERLEDDFFGVHLGMKLVELTRIELARS